MKFLIKIQNGVFNLLNVGRTSGKVTIEEKDAWIKSLGTPKDLVERSYFQNKSQNYCLSNNLASRFISGIDIIATRSRER